jgi:cytochrome c oxidase subunit 2
MWMIFCDAPESWQIGFQDPATPIMEGVIHFHNHLMFFIVLIVTFVCWLLTRVITNYSADVHPVAEKFTHSTVLEIVWTVVPAFLLLFIAVPSFNLLYS